MKLYHGTNQDFEEFSQDKARLINDYYGGGVAYFTDNFDVAETYAKSMARSKGGSLYVFEIFLDIKKLFDVKDEFSGPMLTRFFDSKKDIEEFARGAGLLKYGVDKNKILASLELGNMNLTGEQVFNGLSAGMNKTARARSKLKKLGYDTLRYDGGKNMNAAIKHNVYITYYSNRIHINSKYHFDSFGNKYKKAD